MQELTINMKKVWLQADFPNLFLYMEGQSEQRTTFLQVK